MLAVGAIGHAKIVTFGGGADEPRRVQRPNGTRGGGGGGSRRAYLGKRSEAVDRQSRRRPLRAHLSLEGRSRGKEFERRRRSRGSETTAEESPEGRRKKLNVLGGAGGGTVPVPFLNPIELLLYVELSK